MNAENVHLNNCADFTDAEVDLVLHKIGQENPNAFVLQIGAMDGVSFDDLSGYVSLYKWKGLWVEPMPEMYERLLKHYSTREDYDSLLFENAAISDYDGTIKFVRIPPEVVDSGKVHACFNGMSSIYPPKNGLGSEFDRPTVEKYGETLEVPCITLKNLLSKHNVTEVDLLCIDTEGHDWKVFSQFDLDKYKPKYIKIEACNISEEERQEVRVKLDKAGYHHVYFGQDIHAVASELYGFWENATEEVAEEAYEENSNDLSIVTGIWDLDRENAGEGFKRPFDHYLDNFKKLLKTDIPMFIFIESKYEHIVWENRDRKNTRVIIKEVDDFKKSFEFYEKVQEIRKNKKWLEGNGSTWLKESTQATLDLYNPMVMSKMFMLNDAAIYNDFNTKHFAWLDGGITNTVHEGYFTHDKVLDKVSPLLNKFFFLCFPYETDREIHGFDKTEMDRVTGGQNVNRVARGGFFGGSKKAIHEANALYYNLLGSTLSKGYMGTEESIFTLMTYMQPEAYKYYMIEDNGLINKFFEDLKNDEIETEDFLDVKTNLYVVTFNFPDQLEYLLKSYEGTDFLNVTDKYLIDNSTDESTLEDYKSICDYYGFTHLRQEKNIGICGGRYYAAEHFSKTDAKYMIFLEDDMLLKKDGESCLNGFSAHSNNLFENVVSIMEKEKYDFLKFSFTEFYGNNTQQWAWYNLPDHKRKEYWPNYHKLPVLGLDPNCPLTNFKNIKSLNGLPYASGEIYYCNWPQIVSKKGSKKMFLDVTWAHPHEQTWMSQIFQYTKEGDVNAGILLASPIFHDRKYHYKAEERVES